MFISKKKLKEILEKTIEINKDQMCDTEEICIKMHCMGAIDVCKSLIEDLSL